MVSVISVSALMVLATLVSPTLVWFCGQTLYLTWAFFLACRFQIAFQKKRKITNSWQKIWKYIDGFSSWYFDIHEYRVSYIGEEEAGDETRLSCFFSSLPLPSDCAENSAVAGHHHQQRHQPGQAEVEQEVELVLELSWVLIVFVLFYHVFIYKVPNDSALSVLWHLKWIFIQHFSLSRKTFSNWI